MIEIIHGNSLEEMRKLRDRVDLICTDPPFGIDFQSNARKQKIAKIANDDSPFVWWMRDAYEILPEGGRLLCFCHWSNSDIFRQAIQWAGFSLKGQLIWDKELFSMGDLKHSPAMTYEIVLYGTKGKYEFKNGRPGSIFRSRRVTTFGEDKHPNEKPVELLEQLLKYFSELGETVLDPFMGSCPTGVASKKLERNFIGIDIEERWVRLAKDKLK